MTRKSVHERLEELDRKQGQLAARKTTLEAQVKQAARKQRTRTLIQVGGILATVGVTTVAEAEQLQHYIAQQKAWWAAWQSTTVASK